MAAVLDWARPQSLPITVVPGAGHFFHGQLNLLAKIVDSAATFHLMGGIALWDRLEVSLVAPFAIQNGAGDYASRFA